MSKEYAIKRAAAAYHRRERVRREAQEQLVEAFEAARSAGATYRELGEAIGRSHVAVMKILKA